MTGFRKTLPLLLVPLAGLAASCQGDVLWLAGTGAVEIRLRTSGFITGASQTVFLDGSNRVLVGEECVGICSFTPGDVLETLTPAEISGIELEFVNAGIHGLDGEDFGTECCDQEYVELWYTDEDGSSSVKGTLSLLPSSLAEAVSVLGGMVPRARYVTVDFDHDPASWPQVPLQIQSPQISGDLLSLRVRYAGGCRQHDIRAIAWGGWMESDPVQVHMLLSHDDHGDPCEAVITKTLEFRLDPLKIAYQEVYGTAPPGKTTVRVLLDDPRLENIFGAWVLNYTF